MDLTGDESQRHALVRARRTATAMLGAVAVVFLATVFAPEPAASSTWLGFLQAAAEAAMVGGLADWFAVVALFRHPLGVPIPHTAVIPKSKDGLGANLAAFVADNFLDPDELTHRLERADLADRAGTWLADERNARTAAARLVEVLGGWLAQVDPTRAAEVASGAASRHLNRVPLAALLGQAMEAGGQGPRHDELMTAVIRGVAAAVLDNEPLLRRRLYEESPAWVPEALDDIVFDRALQGLLRLLGEVERDPDHELRRLVAERWRAFAQRLQSDEQLGKVVADRASDLLAGPGVHDWLVRIWQDLIDALDEPDTVDGVVQWLTLRLVDLGGRLHDDPELRTTIEGWVAAAAPAVARESRQEIGALVAATVDRWDAEETSDRLELWLGRDLQFVRINGTVVGGLVGVLLHTFTLLA